MAVTTTTNTPLGAPTTNRKWVLDVNTGSSGTPVWTRVQGIMDFKPARDSTMQDASDFDSGGFKSSVKTAEAWSCELKVVRKVTAALATTYDTGQEALRAKAEGVMGVANQAEIRYYELEPSGPRVHAYQGKVAVEYGEDGGGMDALSTASIKLNGQGALVAITHPAGP